MFRHVLQQYIDEPHSYDEVVYHDDTALIMRDAYPKSSYHYLVIPRLAAITHKHPYDAFKNDPVLYDTIATYVERAKDMIVDDVQATSFLAPENPTSGAEYRARFIRAGVHAAPSLFNLHIHVISQDFRSLRLKHKKHYNSFTTLFFVPFDDLEPVEFNADSYGYASDSDAGEWSDPELGHAPHLERDKDKLDRVLRESPLVCTYCGADFGNGFGRLKLHLEDEFRKAFHDDRG